MDPAHQRRRVDELSRDLLDLKTAIQQSQQALNKSHNELARQIASRLLPPVQGGFSFKGYAAVLLEGARLRGGLSDVTLMPVHACVAEEQFSRSRDMHGHAQPCHGLVKLPGRDGFASVSDDKSIKVRPRYLSAGRVLRG